MFGMFNRKPRSRFDNISTMATRRWNQITGNNPSAWEQAGETIKAKPWIGALAGVLLISVLAFTFGRHFWGQTEF